MNAKELTQLVGECLGRNVTLASTLRDELGLDVLAVVELAGELEARSELVFSHRQLFESVTVGDFLKLP